MSQNNNNEPIEVKEEQLEIHPLLLHIAEPVKEDLQTEIRHKEDLYTRKKQVNKMRPIPFNKALFDARPSNTLDAFIKSMGLSKLQEETIISKLLKLGFSYHLMFTEKNLFGSSLIYKTPYSGAIERSFFSVEMAINFLLGHTESNLEEKVFYDFIKKINFIEEAYINKNYGTLITTFISKPQRLPFFFEHFEELETELESEQIAEIFLSIYQTNEYDFDQIDWDLIIPYLMQIDNNTAQLKNIADEDGYITIYRGEADKSSCIEDAKSWTLSKDTALFFAKRFLDQKHSLKNRYIHTGKVKLEDILHYMSDTSEREVLVEYTSIIDITTEPLETMQ